jgi:hypothetical protein
VRENTYALAITELKVESERIFRHAAVDQYVSIPSNIITGYWDPQLSFMQCDVQAGSLRTVELLGVMLNEVIWINSDILISQ